MVREPQVSFKPNNIDALLIQLSNRTGGGGFCLYYPAFCRDDENIQNIRILINFKYTNYIKNKGKSY